MSDQDKVRPTLIKSFFSLIFYLIKIRLDEAQLNLTKVGCFFLFDMK